MKSPIVSSLSTGNSGKANLVARLGQTTTGRLPFLGVVGYGGNPSFYAGGICPRLEENFGESLDSFTPRETLKRINMDVSRCLTGLDQVLKVAFVGNGSQPKAGSSKPSADPTKPKTAKMSTCVSCNLRLKR